ncbi:nucleoid occlusion factor SlmA [Larsenimonas suaedae]|uniref:Nucleoid occlusion factor SlmA n=1 Tax=Larsenimonas suaedae TaxID=1851019 RepID=A0ABU1GWW7_9GAMM|nr:nucleoid occlusion factor SlmA [Larsenimonas suaedae]MCM2973106.1 nucleoid occlusion factor SlmA [Larsenimonas suaedae]MDR5896543.1 nucleoid occlusion factor SlmA [Larsenimonas suaedae]
MATTKKGAERREQILQALAKMLESDDGKRITTASLASEVGVSEAALYRHFPSKSKMFEALIDYIETIVFERLTVIARDDLPIDQRCHHTLKLVIGFAEKNPGLCRLMTGEALVGETARLKPRMQQFFDRIETQLKQSLREAQASEQARLPMTVGACAHLLMTHLEGRITRYSRSRFRHSPAEHWDEQWAILSSAVFAPERAHLAL